jgi:Protein of unknown function (DUF2911)
MHRLRFLPLLLAMLLLAILCQAQSAVLDLPRQSQHGVVTQRIGITDVTINYHRPLVNGRKIWGGIVPYGQVWRAGANENTTISFSDPVTIEGQPLQRGTYGLHMIPGNDDWTVIFSKNSTSWGSFTYKQDEDALRVNVKPQSADMHEALTYDFEQPAANSAVVTMRWEKVAVPFKVGVDVNQVVSASLHNQLRGLSQYTWEGWDDAANYLIDNKGDLQEALKYSNNSIENEERYDNLMTKSKALDALGRKQEAATTRQDALTRANAIQSYVYARQLQRDHHADEALAVYRSNAKKFPKDWITHAGVARVYVSQGDYDSAVKEMKVALDGAPDGQKSGVETLVKRLQAKEDINK